MDNITKTLEVPQEPLLRKKLREEACAFYSATDLQPPIKLNTLEKLAYELLKQNNISDDYLEFTMVLLGNESWRKTVKATPFNRRLLLIPQCLRNSTSCKATFDSLGLICSGCKGCSIDDILNKAEELGYTTLVAEGTTVAVGLVEEGAIDAVIGVSCMPVLERSFKPVSNAAVPVIGLPLMYDGCENTKIDSDWLYEEIRNFTEDNENQPISISLLKSQIQDYFTDQSLASHFIEVDFTENIAKEYLLIGGQRMRPLLATLSYIAYSNSGYENDILPQIALIIECFHKASLIHDDIQDNTDIRYDNDTIHKKYGIPHAINVGDYLIGKGYQILSNLPAQAALITRALKVISNSHIRLTKGQGADIQINSGEINSDIEQTLNTFKQKTGEAIKVALLLGGILGEAKDSELIRLEQFSDYLGISYQIRDDLNEFQENNKTEKVGDFPFLKAILNEHQKKSNAILSENIFGNVEVFRNTIEALKLKNEAEKYLNHYIQKCYNTLDLLQNKKLRLSLYSVLGKIFKQAPFYD
jgi:geranylgeranyl pyrophosphate synthase